jgi:hypothetical protein
MTVPRPHQWTEVEVHRLRMLAKREEARIVSQNRSAATSDQ